MNEKKLGIVENTTPLSCRLLIEKRKGQYDVKTKTKSGILLAHAQKREIFEGEVVAIGEDVTLVKVGDLVVFGSHSGYFYGDGVELEYWMMKDDDLIALIKEYST